MMRIEFWTAVFVAAHSCTALALQGQDLGSDPHRLVVATRHVPPFAMRDEAGNWSGITIDLLDEVVRGMNAEASGPLEVEYLDMPLADMLDAAQQGEVDLAAAALTVNFDREVAMDFSHPYYSSGLGIAIVPEQDNAWLSVTDRIFSLAFLKLLGGLLLLLFVSGIAIFLFEHRRNREQFGGGLLRGLGAGVWWSIVTLTTVGYGDKAPQSFGGRCIAATWMLAGLLIISAFTAAVTATLTVGELRLRVNGPGDLPRVRVGTVAASTSEAYLSGHRLRARKYTELPQALAALKASEVDAVVYDAPILRYQVLQSHPTISVLPGTFQRQDYAFALPTDSAYREDVNRGLLRVIGAPEWQETLSDYLGEIEMD